MKICCTSILELLEVVGNIKENRRNKGYKLLKLIIWFTKLNSEVGKNCSKFKSCDFIFQAVSQAIKKPM